MKNQKLTKLMRIRITKKEKADLMKIGKKLGFKSLSAFLMFIIRTETNRVLNDIELEKAYRDEAISGTLLLIP